MCFIIAILLLFGEGMIQSISFDTKKINDFINTVSKQRPTAKEYHSFIDHGKKIAGSLLDGSGLAQPFVRKEYLKNIIAFAWYLYAIAIQKGQGFTSGVIVIEDKDQKIYNFLYEYVKQVNPKKLLSRSLISLNPYGYSRQSTHFIPDQKNFIQHGIDVRFYAEQKAQRLLPGSKTHMLFGRLAEGMTFIKFERYGLYYKDGFVGHALGFLRHIAGRVISRIITQEDKPLHKKEYMPEWIKNACKGLPFKKQPRTIKDIFQQSLTDTRLTPLVARIAKQYDHLAMRHGGEVIISRKELDDFSGAR